MASVEPACDSMDGGQGDAFAEPHTDSCNKEGSHGGASRQGGQQGEHRPQEYRVVQHGEAAVPFGQPVFDSK